MIMKWWFKAEKVEYPSEEPPQGKPIDTLYGMVMEEDDIPYYRLFKYGSIIYIYDMHNYFFFLARQHAYDWRTRTKALHAEYRLTLTEGALNIVNKLLKAPFECYAENESAWKDYLYYKCKTSHQAYIPTQYNGNVIQARWYCDVYIRKIEVEIPGLEFNSTIPFNCGPLRPLWERAVECWVDKIVIDMIETDITPEHTADLVDAVRRELLKYKYLDSDIIPKYRI